MATATVRGSRLPCPAGVLGRPVRRGEPRLRSGCPAGAAGRCRVAHRRSSLGGANALGRLPLQPCAPQGPPPWEPVGPGPGPQHVRPWPRSGVVATSRGQSQRFALVRPSGRFGVPWHCVFRAVTGLARTNPAGCAEGQPARSASLSCMLGAPAAPAPNRRAAAPIAAIAEAHTNAPPAGRAGQHRIR